MIFFDSEIRPAKSAAFSGDNLDNVGPAADVFSMEHQHQQLADDAVSDSLSVVSLLSEGGLRQANDARDGSLRQANDEDDGLFARMAINDKLESTWSEVSVSDEEDHDDVVASEGQELRFSAEMVYNGSMEECRPSVERPVEGSRQEDRSSLVRADDDYTPHECRHSVVTERANTACQHIDYAGGDAAINNDTAALPQPSTAHCKTSEHTSYKDDFTVISDDHGVQSDMDSRFVELFTMVVTLRYIILYCLFADLARH